MNNVHQTPDDRGPNNLEPLAAMLYDMPGLVFAKEVGTGTYIACNRQFAEVVHKGDPLEVIGRTDFDLYDAETAASFIEHDRETLAMDEPNVYYEDVSDARGRQRQTQTTKMKYIDALGRQCVMGISVDVSSAMAKIKENIQMMEAYARARNESVTYSRIARALSADYASLYYVDLNTDQFIEFSSQSGRESLSFERRENDFFNASCRDALSQLYPEDQEMFIRAFTKENMLRTLDTQGTFTLTYRLLMDGAPTYVNMKAMRMHDDDSHIIIGVTVVDAQMKEREAFARIQEERITYSRISALTGGYICIYTVDPHSDRYLEYSATTDYEGLGLAKAGEDFFNQARRESLRTLCPDDVDMFNAMFTKENVVREIGQNGVFVMRYRLMMDGVARYVSLQAAMVEEKDGPQIIVGVNNIDAQVRREQAYAHDLSVAQARACVDALTGVKNKHAYIDAEEALNRQIEEEGTAEFAIVVCDVNGLKTVNDHRGHKAGDTFLREACHIICEVFDHSPVFRIGGDEFVVIARGRDYAEIDELVGRLQAINRKNSLSGGIVIACGMARYQGEGIVEDVFNRADDLMYENKGRLKELARGQA